MNYLLAVLLHVQGGVKNFCGRHLIADSQAPYGDISNVDLVWSHSQVAEPDEDLQIELSYRVRMGLITAGEISQIKRELERRGE